MKEHNLDKLFRQKLQDHSVPPTPAAWDKLASNLNTRRRTRRGYYAAAAAAVLLLMLASIGLWQNEGRNVPDQQQPVVAVQEHVPSPTTSAPVGAGTTEVKDSPTAPAEEVNEAPSSSPEVASPAQLAAIETPNQKAASPQATLPSATEQDTPAPAEAGQSLPEASAEPLLAQELPAAPSSQGVTLPVTETISPPNAAMALAHAEQVVIRYDTSTPDDKNADRGKAPEKVFSLMKKVKQGEIGLADIRKAKDNLLSGRLNKP
jgi:hypothetical protein